ncbi:hypothetical protein IFM61392_06157 [Aspergillus lentulus]|nr:hypothetical protein IFM61392_06157 [Aspergillus lentulus]
MHVCLALLQSTAPFTITYTLKMKLIYLLTSLTAMALAAPSPLGEYVCHPEAKTCATISGPIGVCCPGLKCVYISPDLGVCQPKDEST